MAYGRSGARPAASSGRPNRWPARRPARLAGSMTKAARRCATLSRGRLRLATLETSLQRASSPDRESSLDRSAIVKITAAGPTLSLFALILAAATAPLSAAVAAPLEKSPALPVEIVPPTQHTQGINSAVFSHDDEDRFVASSGEDGVIKLWDVKTGRLNTMLPGSIRTTSIGGKVALQRWPAPARILRLARSSKLWDTLPGGGGEGDCFDSSRWRQQCCGHVP